MIGHSVKTRFSFYTITGKGAEEWQFVIEALPGDVGRKLNEDFRPERDYSGGNLLIMKAHGYYWSHTYAKGNLTVLVQPAPPDHPEGRADITTLEAHLDSHKLKKLHVVRQ